MCCVCSARAATLDELVNRPIPLRNGIGSAHDAVSTSSKQAQAWYDQGLAYLHSYVWIEAARSFNQALRIDPALAMAHVGLTCAYIELNAPAAARSALDEARSLAGSASDHDRAHIAARTLQMDAEAARHASQRLIDYRAALDAALAKFPDDEELFLLRGHAESSDPAERGQGSGAAAVHFYEKARALAPVHASAHHYLTHAYENTGRIDEARQELALVPDDVLDDWVVAARISQAMYERNFSEAINIVERKLNSLAPNQPLDSFAKAFLVQMGQCQEWLGQHEAARQTFERALREIKPTPDTVVRPDANGTPSILAQAYAGLGEKEKALQQAAQAVKDYNGDAVNQPQAEVPLAQIQARFGDHDSAIAALPHLLEVPAGLTVANLKFDPLWDPLRKDPRFQKLCAGK